MDMRSILADPNLLDRTYTIQLGHKNLLWNEAKDREQVIFYEPAELDGFIKARDEQGAREFLRRHKRSNSYGELYDGNDAGEPWITMWLKRHGLFRANEPALMVHYQTGAVWWTITTGDWNDAEITKLPEPFENLGDHRFIRLSTVTPWRHTTLKGLELRATPEIVPPRLIDGILTETTIQRIKDERAACLVALLLDEDLSTWTTRPDWAGAAYSIRAANWINHERTSLDDFAFVDRKRNIDPSRLEDLVRRESWHWNDTAGYVYIAKYKKAFSGQCKIGRARVVADRMMQLGAAAPETLESFHSVYFEDCFEAESAMHRNLAKSRVRSDREWFQIDAETAKGILDSLRMRVTRRTQRALN